MTSSKQINAAGVRMLHINSNLQNIRNTISNPILREELERREHEEIDGLREALDISSQTEIMIEKHIANKVAEEKKLKSLVDDEYKRQDNAMKKRGAFFAIITFIAVICVNMQQFNEICIALLVTAAMTSFFYSLEKSIVEERVTNYLNHKIK